MMRLFLSLLLVLAGLFRLDAQETATLSGRITGPEGEEVVFANISLKNSRTGTTSDTTGSYSLLLPAGQDLVIVFSCVGYNSLEDTLRLSAGEERRLDPVLTRSLSELDEVTVEAQYRRTNTFVRLNIKDFEYIPNTSGQFENILKTLPGVSSNNELSAQYSVRGGNFDENLVYVNDVEVYRPFLIRSGQQEGLSFINPDMVSSVKFSAGGFGAEYGDKMSSVLDISYKKPQRNGGSVSASFLGGSAHLEGLAANKRISYLAGLRYKTTRYLLQSTDVAGDYQPSFFDFQTYITYRIHPDWEVSFLGNIARNNYRFIPEDRRTSFGTISDAVQLYILYDGQEVDRFDTGTGALIGTYRPSPSLTMKWIVSAFRTNEAETFDIQGRYSLNQIDKELGSENLGDSILNIGIGRFLNHARNFLQGTIASAEYKASYVAGAGEWNWGVKYQREWVDNSLHEWELIDSAGFSIPYDNQQVNLANVSLGDLSLRSGRLSSYLQLNRRISTGRSTLYLDAGIRASYWNLNQEFLLSPRVTLWIDPGWRREIQFHLSGGSYYQPPFFREFTDREGNSNLDIRSQRSFHAVAGTDIRFRAWTRPFVFSGEVYYKYLDRLIPYKLENVRIRYAGENMARGYAVGIDMKLNGEFVPGTDSWASLSLMQTREDITGDRYVNEEGIVETPGYYPRPTDQLLNFGMFFQDYLPGNPSYRVQLSLLYGSRLPVSSPYTDRYDRVFRMPPYRRVDIGFIKVFVEEGDGKIRNGFFAGIRHLSLSAEIFNLLDINNTVSYLWLSTVNNLSGETRQFAVPNYLTSRRLNLKMSLRF